MEAPALTMIQALGMMWPLLLIVWMHFICDFLLQTDEIAKQKSTSNEVLVWHVTLYSAPFIIFGWKFMVANWIGHFVVDYVTSRLTSYFHRTENRRAFFITIGADQALHLSMLFFTYFWLGLGA